MQVFKNLSAKIYLNMQKQHRIVLKVISLINPVISRFFQLKGRYGFNGLQFTGDFPTEKF